MPPLLQQAIVHRFFFALMPDEITARRTYAFADRELGPKGLLEPERHHVTLGLTDDQPFVPGAMLDALLRAGDTVRGAPFDLVLDRLSGGVGTVALRPSRVIRPLRDLQSRIAAAMREQGLAMRAQWQFSPHETLTYRKGTSFSRMVPAFEWKVSDFVLVHSHVGLHRHDIIGRWALRASEEKQGTLF